MENKKKLSGIILLTFFIGFSGGMLTNRYLIQGEEVEGRHEYRILEDKRIDSNMPFAIFKFKESTGELWYSRKQDDGVLYWEKISHPENMKK
jgi:hypothetical protein